MANDEALMYQHLAAEGLPLPDIAGIMGNAQVESGFNPAATNPREGAVGFFQWEGGRKSQLDALAAARGTSDTDPNTQLAFLDQELAGPYAAVMANLRSTNDPAVAARYFDVGPGGTNSGTGFENSSGSATGTRESFAQAIFGQISHGQIPAGAAGGVQDVSVKHGTWLNPLNWPANIYDDTVVAGGQAAGNAVGSAASGVAGGVLKVVLPFATKVTFVVAGLAIIGLGLYRASAPERQKAADVAEKAAPLAAATAL